MIMALVILLRDCNVSEVSKSNGWDWNVKGKEIECRNM
jgi:hypothetical protein